MYNQRHPQNLEEKKSKLKRGAGAASVRSAEAQWHHSRWTPKLEVEVHLRIVILTINTLHPPPLISLAANHSIVLDDILLPVCSDISKFLQ